MQACCSTRSRTEGERRGPTAVGLRVGLNAYLELNIHYIKLYYIYIVYCRIYFKIYQISILNYILCNIFEIYIFEIYILTVPYAQVYGMRFIPSHFVSVS